MQSTACQAPRLAAAILAGAVTALAAPASAQIVSDVSGADVTASGSHISIRTGLRAGLADAKPAFATRFHAQWSVDNARHVRGGGTWAKRAGRSGALASVFLESVWQTHESERARMDSALRLDATLGLAPGAPDRMRASWLGQFDLGATWVGRTNLSVARDFGPQAGTSWPVGIGLSLGRDIGRDMRLTGEYLGDTGSRAAQAGLVLSGPLPGRWTYAPPSPRLRIGPRR